jgi:hypothetical protein
LASYRIDQQSGALTPLAVEAVGQRPAAAIMPLTEQDPSPILYIKEIGDVAAD